MIKIREDYDDRRVQILSVNPINREGKVESDAKRYKLPFPVLVGRDTDIVKDYRIKGLPRIIIIDIKGQLAFYEKFAPAEEIQEILDSLLEEVPSESSQGK